MSYEPSEDHLHFDRGDREPPGRGLRGVLVAVAVGVVAVAVLAAAARTVGDWIAGLGGLGDDQRQEAEIEEGRVVNLVIPPGTSSRGIASILAGQGVIPSANDFEAVVRSRGVQANLQAGQYELVAGTDLNRIVDVLLEGPNITTFRLTLVEGRRIGEALEDIAAQTRFTAGELAAALAGGQVNSPFSPPEAEGLTAWEGLLFPETYEFFSDDGPVRILQRLADETVRRAGQVDWTQLEEGGRSVYEGMVIASIIESEAGVDADRPLIASVVYNRLRVGMPLQIDATVLYALGTRGASPSLADLETDSPYNTYQMSGLPPTPIGTFSLRSLQAAAAPADTDFIYYVLTSEDGSHSFFAEYGEFLQAKADAQARGIGQ